MTPAFSDEQNSPIIHKKIKKFTTFNNSTTDDVSNDISNFDLTPKNIKINDFTAFNKAATFVAEKRIHNVKFIKKIQKEKMN
jgi:hypothetical protein